MKLKSVLFVVNDINKSRKFYIEVLGLRVISDFGANITLTGGLALQTKSSWKVFISKEKISYGGCDAEVYFEEENFDLFLNKLKTLDFINYVHKVKEHDWGQRVVRFYDLDKHIIEVGEPLESVCKRFLANGLSIEETAKRTMMTVSFIKRCMEK